MDTTAAEPLNPGVEIISDGTKFFSGAQLRIRILVVLHCSYDLVEVICYDASNNTEKLRAYLNHKVLVSLQSEEHIAARTERLVRKASHVHLPTVPNEVQSEALKETMYDFIASRIRPSFGVLELRLLTRDKAEFTKVGYGNEKLVVEKPKTLKPFQLEEAQLSAGRTMTTKEKWRAPLVIAKVAKGRRLSAVDHEIWDNVNRTIAEAYGDDCSVAPAPAITETTQDAPAAAKDNKKGEHKHGLKTHGRRNSITAGIVALATSLHSSLVRLAPRSLDSSHRPHTALVLDTTKHVDVGAVSESPLLTHVPRAEARRKGTKTHKPKKHAHAHHATSNIVQPPPVKEQTMSGSVRASNSESQYWDHYSRRVYFGTHPTTTEEEEEGSEKSFGDDAEVVQDTPDVSAAAHRGTPLSPTGARTPRSANTVPGQGQGQGGSSCDQANRELRAARMFEGLLSSHPARHPANDPVKLVYTLNTSQAHASRINGYADRGGKHSAAPWSDAPVPTGTTTPAHRDGLEEGEDDEGEEMASEKVSQDMSRKADAAKGSMLRPVRQLIERVTRRSISTVVPSQ